MMEVQHTASALTDRVNLNIAQLLRRFENIIALAPIDDHSLPTTATSTYQIEVETTALIRSAEDILLLTRALKEMWLFGQLDTIGLSEAEKQTQEDARAVAGMLAKVMGEGGYTGGEKKDKSVESKAGEDVEME